MRDSLRRAQPAQPARPPTLSDREQRRDNARRMTLRARVQMEQRSLLRGLILIALVVLIVSLARAGFDRLFVPGWWGQW
jgi:hypothetical protein